DASSTSPRRRSPGSRRSGRASARSASPGRSTSGSPSGIPTDGAEPPRSLGRRALKTLAARHGVRPSKALGQHFLADPNLARRIAALGGAAPGERVLEIGAGLGSLTVALADAGADVTAVELDRGLLPALEEAVAGRANVRVV